jgi:uroporphyrinogen-III synthase
VTLNVLITRPKKQADNLCELIEQSGGTPIRFPVLDIVPVEPSDKIKRTLNALQQYQWLFFVSVNAVNFALRANNGKIDISQHIYIVAVGQATARALRNAGLNVNLVPEQGFNTEAILAMPQLQTLNGQSCLIVRGHGGRELLAQTLEERGAQVYYLELYRRIMPEIDTGPVERLLHQNKLDVITITSGEALKNLLKMLDSSVHHQLLATPLAVISQRIRHLAIELGFKQVFVSEQPADTALVKAIVNGEKCGRSE